MSEGLAKESRRAGTAEYVTKDNTTIMRHTFWQTLKVCQSFFTHTSPKSQKSQKSYPSHQFKIQNSKFFSPKDKAPKLINNEYKLTIEDLKLLTKN